MGHNHTETELQHLATLPSIPVHQIYQHLLNNSLQLTPFNTQPSGDTNTLWKLFTHPGTYVSALAHFYQLQLDYSVAISFGADLPD